MPVAAEADWPMLRTYEGEQLQKVKMPLGGIGTGTISLSGRGAFVDWEIQNRPAKGYTPTTGEWPPAYNPSFVIRCQAEGEDPVARLLEGPLPYVEYEGGRGCRAANHGFPRFEKATFRAAYPLAEVDLTSKDIPVSVRLEAMNPLVPGDACASGIPAVLLRWRVRNKTAKQMAVSICGTMVNFAGLDPQPGKVTGSGDVDREERIFEDGQFSGVVLSGSHRSRMGMESRAMVDNRDGEVALLLKAGSGCITVSTDMHEPGWGVGMDRWWRRFLSEGDVQDSPSDDTTAGSKQHLAQLCSKVELSPGEERTIEFVLSWRFPHRHAWQWDRDSPSVSTECGNWYAKEWGSATEAGAFLLSNLESLEASTVAFVRSVVNARAPEAVREAALFNLSTFRTETCFRTAKGDFFGWEGCDERQGSCKGSCTHVWGYEHALVDLWPDLARSMLDAQFGVQLSESGHMRFRVDLPLERNLNTKGLACADGQMQCIIKAYEYWQKTGDDTWLCAKWPRIYKALAFSWIKGGWDADRDGVMEGCQHNTMDVEYYGPNPQMEFLYLCALQAASRMAQKTGNAALATDLRELAESGSRWFEAHQFNGDYYEHEIRIPRGEIAEGLRHSSMGAKDLSDPDFQLGAGCLIDQLLGDYSALAVGLDPVANRDHARRTLATILRKCGKRRIESEFNPMRSYVMDGEASLKMAWYPEDRIPRSPFPYYRETMSGFEYVVAALLAWAGDVFAAENVVRNIRDRYDGIKRNPFDEAECGHHYVRALSSWTVLKAFDPGVRIGGLPCVDLSGDRARHSFVAEGSPTEYHGHPTTVLMDDGRTLYCVWPTGHGGHAGNLAVSHDSGVTWRRVDGRLPEGAKFNVECPLIHCLKGPDGVSRLWVWSGFKAMDLQGAQSGVGTAERFRAAAEGASSAMPSLMSEDGGLTWREMPPLGTKFRCILSFQSVLRLNDGVSYLGLYHRGPTACVDNGPLEVVSSVTHDGGFTWSDPKVIARSDDADLCEPWAFRSPGGTEICVLMRNNRLGARSKVVFSRDEGLTWSNVRTAPLGLTGHRHNGVVLPDGRVAVCMRNVALPSPLRYQFVAWIGSYDSIKTGMDSPTDYHVKLLHSYGGWDCGYSGVHLLPDDTVVVTTYVKYAPGPEKNSVVTTRFKVSDTDKMLKDAPPFVWGKITDCEKYKTLHPRLTKALEFLKRPDLATLPVGRYEIEADNCWAMVQSCELTPFGEIQHPEVHRDFIDIQAPLDGPETYGLYDTKGKLFEPFDAAKDIGFADAKTEPLTLQPGEFAIFFPGSGAHAPCKTLGSKTMRKKLVIKVRK